METMELHRGRLINHIQLVVRDLPAARRFYTAVFESLDIPISGSGDDDFWADELFICTPDSEAAQGVLTGRHHLALQAQSRSMVEAFTKLLWPMAEKITALPESGHIIRVTTPLSFLVRRAIILKPYITARQNVARHRYMSLFNLQQTAPFDLSVTNHPMFV